MIFHPLNAIGKLKKQKKWKYQVNTSTNTVKCGCTDSRYTSPGHESIDVHYIFRDQMKFDYISRGQSSTRAKLVSRSGTYYELSPIEIGFFIQVLTGLTKVPFSIDSEGYIDIHFLYIKQGSNVGIEFVDPETVEYTELRQ